MESDERERGKAKLGVGNNSVRVVCSLFKGTQAFRISPEIKINKRIRDNENL